MHLVIVFITAITVVRANLYQECAKLYNPNNYMDHLPSLHLPYMGNVPIPNNTPKIKPSPVVNTKAISIVTKYVYKNPVCVKYTKNKNMCKQDNGIKHKSNIEQLVTKEYFVNDRKKQLGENHNLEDYDEDEEEEDYSGGNLYIQSSEDRRSIVKGNKKTPHLSKKKIHEMLIEDRLDQLETILPHYTRRRTYETSTITVTKVISNRRTMATLIIKNCIPQGYDFCSPKTRKRKSKVAQLTNNANESNYFG
ncbi:hypothetical protein NQ314_016238 [Rhamnusium bicolor]|uniref:Uncharacterized protein n=1 Tax=Rhamnusium bicolor TaxID=1586634 RepID=A0AAV8WWB0_9CUCU|nr:hypothetical protein NQ314_016238 [Rhamnusium bicolor]